MPPILAFLLPDADWLQLSLFTLMFTLTAGVLLALRRQARPSVWAARWRDSDMAGAHDLDSEHGSVHDLSEAIATPAEKLAEVMPGILLILGLLGTFIGLGLALNNASALLTQASSASGDLDGMMLRLMDMLQGLGAKFKSSTWGICAFLLLRAGAAANGFDARRLRWVIGQVNQELRARRQDDADAGERHHLALVQAIEQLGHGLIQHQGERHHELRAVLAQHQRLLHAHTQHGEKLVEQGGRLCTMVDGIGQARRDHLASMGDAVSAMTQAADRIGFSAQALQQALLNAGNHVGQALTALKDNVTDLADSIGGNLNKNLDKTTASVVFATQDISTAIRQLSQDIDIILRGIQDSIASSTTTQQHASALLNDTRAALTQQLDSMVRATDKLEASLHQPALPHASTAPADAPAALGALLHRLNERIEALTLALEDHQQHNKDAHQHGLALLASLDQQLRGLSRQLTLAQEQVT